MKIYDCTLIILPSLPATGRLRRRFGRRPRPRLGLRLGLGLLRLNGLSGLSPSLRRRVLEVNFDRINHRPSTDVVAELRKGLSCLDEEEVSVTVAVLEYDVSFLLLHTRHPTC